MRAMRVCTFAVWRALAVVLSTTPARAAGVTVLNTITANGLTLTSNLDLGIGDGGAVRPLDFRSNNSLDDGGFELLNVSTLSGIAATGSISFGNTNNSVATLGGFSVGTSFTFADSVDLTIANTLSATAVSLTAPNLNVSGTITTGGSATGSVTLVANKGTIGETGVIATGTLSGSAVGAATFAGAMKIWRCLE